MVKNPPAMQQTWIRFLGWEDPLGEEKATHSSILAWRSPRTVRSLGSQRVGHNWATFTFAIFWTEADVRVLRGQCSFWTTFCVSGERYLKIPGQVCHQK